MTTKKCARCGEIKSLSMFYICKSRLDGHDVICKDCALQKALDYASKHKEQKRDYDKQYRANHKEEGIAKATLWRISNPDARKAIQRRYRDSHKEEIHRKVHDKRYINIDDARAKEQKKRDASRDRPRKRLRNWKRNHPESVKADKENRRAKEANVPGKFTGEDIKHLYSIQDGVCVYHSLNPYCLVDLNFAYHIDHIVPIVRGGSNSPDNLQLLCHLCNEAKGRKNDKEFRDWLASVYPK